MKYLLIGLSAALLICLGYIIFVLGNDRDLQVKEAAYWRNKAFKTDTVYSNTTYVAPPVTPSEEKVPPIQTIIYEPDLKSSGFLEFKNRVSKFIDSNRKDTTTLSDNYLTLFPKASKLLAAKFRRDTISLDLLDIFGKIRRDTYPVDYSVFNYDYKDNQIFANEIKTSTLKLRPTSKLFQYNGTYLEYKYDFLNTQHQVEINSTINLWRLRVGGFIQNPATQPLNLKTIQGGAKVGIRLF